MSLTRRRALAAAMALPSMMAGCAMQLPALAPVRRLPGMVWQPSNSTLYPRGHWQDLGIHRLLVQWTAVDNQSFIPEAGLPPIGAEWPDWRRIAGEPWAREVILGLAGMHAETAARASLAELAEQSRRLAAAAALLPLRISEWYFPVEIDPTWTAPAHLTDVLEALPRPLWISAYDSANLGPQALTDWIERHVPPHVGVFFQDGVGVHARVPAVAREYLRMLSARLGRARVRVIAEAFRPKPESGFRSATAEEFLPQIDAYQDWPIFAFDGPHYLHDALTADLAASGVGKGAGEGPLP